MNRYDLSGKTALVGGASRGIGAACAFALAESGARVVVLARDKTALERVRGELSGSGHAALAVDHGRLEELEQCVREWVQAKGPVHVVVNNSGGPAAGPVGDASWEAFPPALAQHVGAAHILSKLVIPGMKTAGYGRIVNIISTSVKQPLPGLGVSNVVRGAMASWAKTLANEVAGFGITVNNVLPGATQTDRLTSLIAGKAKRTGHTPADVEDAMIGAIPAGRFGKPAEIAAAVAFLASPDAAYVNGINLPVDGGRTGSL